MGDGSDYDMGIDEAWVPSAPVVSVSPASPSTVDALQCTVTTPSTVAPGLTAQYEYSWSAGGVMTTHGPKAGLTDTLNPSYTHKHEEWTCTVRCWDGLIHGHPASGSVTIQNTPPGPLELSLPLVQADTANVRCLMNKSPDPDGDIVYTVLRWYLARGGPEAEWTGAVLTTDTFSQIDQADTEPGDLWRCEVTYGDGEVPDQTVSSGTCQILTHGTTPSYISLAVAPQTVTLGELVTASGQIFPAPGPGANVFFESTSPGGVVRTDFPEGLVISGDRYSRTFTPTEASQGRAPWQVEASWPGDDTYMPATSDAAAFTVMKALPTVALELSASSVPLGYAELSATAVLAGPVPASLTHLLAGKTVKLWLKKPDGSAAGPVAGTTAGDGRATFPPSAFASAGIAFTSPGTWQFLAEFEGDSNFLPATSTGYDEPESVRLTVKDRAGYAVIVVGKLNESGEGHAEHAKTGDFVYRSFRERGFALEDIYYLREGPVDPDIYVADTTPTQSDVQYALASWAAAQMNAAAAPLYVVLLNHGGVGAFFVYWNSYGESRIVTPSELDGYLDAL